jgi:hypothetical protein
MCKIIINHRGTLIAPAIIRIPASNFVASFLRDNPLITSLKPIEDNVAFIADTGAQVTCLSGLDADRLHIERRFLEPAQNVIGVGGICSAYKLSSIEIGLIDGVDGDRITFHIEQLDYICVIDSLKMTSLLGTDFLGRFDIITNRAKSSAQLKRLPQASGNFQIVSRTIVRSKAKTNPKH